MLETRLYIVARLGRMSILVFIQQDTSSNSKLYVNDDNVDWPESINLKLCSVIRLSD